MAYQAAANVAVANCINLVFQNLFSDMINVGFVQVATNVSGNNSNVSQTVNNLFTVFKSPAANNLIGNDWFILLGTDVTNQTTITMTVAAGYNTTTNSVSGFPPTIVSAPVAANGFVNFGPNTCNSSGNVYVYHSQTFPTTGNGINWIYSVTIDRVILTIANAATQTNCFLVYAGEYDSFLPLSIDPYPIVMTTIAATGQINDVTVAGAGVSINESTGNTVTTAGGFSCQTANWTQIGLQDPYLKGNYGISKVAISGRGASINQTGIRGLLKDVLVSGQPAVRGDQLQYTFNATTFTYVFAGLTVVNSITFAGGNFMSPYWGWINKI